MNAAELYGLAPTITLSVVGSLALLLEVAGIPIGARRLGPRGHIAFVTVVGIAIAAAFAAGSWDEARTPTLLFSGHLQLDRFGLLVSLMACAAALISVCLSVHYMRARDLERGEVFALITFSAA